ncbi:MAG TPA: hypothetical protein VGC65_05120 [Bacteroidia bacterium]|jgi:hypothetical protein
MKKAKFSFLFFFLICLNGFSHGDSLRYYWEPFAKVLISGSYYKGMAVSPGLVVRINKSAIGIGALILSDTDSELGHRVGSGLSGWNAFYNYSPFSRSRKVRVSFTYDLLFEQFSKYTVYSRVPYSIDPYYMDRSYREMKTFVENYIGTNVECSVTKNLRLFGAVGLGCSYSIYTKRGARFDDRRTALEPGGIIKVGLNYAL